MTAMNTAKNAPDIYVVILPYTKAHGVKKKTH